MLNFGASKPRVKGVARTPRAPLDPHLRMHSSRMHTTRTLTEGGSPSGGGSPSNGGSPSRGGSPSGGALHWGGSPSGGFSIQRGALHPGGCTM